MTTRYVGKGGSDGADGLTWANRKETLNGVEDSPAASTDVIYVGPGTYRETLVVDVGNVAYIGDVTGENTDGIGGVVRWTGLTDDSGYATLSPLIDNTGAFTLRDWSGFYFETTSNGRVITTNGMFGGVLGMMPHGLAHVSCPTCREHH